MAKSPIWLRSRPPTSYRGAADDDVAASATVPPLMNCFINNRPSIASVRRLSLFSSSLLRPTIYLLQWTAPSQQLLQQKPVYRLNRKNCSVSCVCVCMSLGVEPHFW